MKVLKDFRKSAAYRNFKTKLKRDNSIINRHFLTMLEYISLLEDQIIFLHSKIDQKESESDEVESVD